MNNKNVKHPLKFRENIQHTLMFTYSPRIHSCNYKFSRDIWTRTVAEDALGRRMSVLGVSEAKSPDGGRWSCAAQDAGRRRCRALRLSVLKPPDIRLVPSTLTVNKVKYVKVNDRSDTIRFHRKRPKHTSLPWLTYYAANIYSFTSDSQFLN